jgi:hypothetical protein
MQKLSLSSGAVLNADIGYTDNKQLWATFSCTREPLGCLFNQSKSGNTPASGWKFETFQFDCSEIVNKKISITKPSSCTHNIAGIHNITYNVTHNVTIPCRKCRGSAVFKREPCYKTIDINGRQTAFNCGPNDEVLDETEITSFDDCIKNYDNERVPHDECPESTYGGSYNHDPSKDVQCNDPWSFVASNFTDSEWAGSFGSYTFKIEIPANVYNVRLVNPVELYPTSSFDDVYTNLGTSAVQSVLATDLDEYGVHNCHSYSTIATNCTLELASRTVLDGLVGSTPIKAQKSNNTQSVTISPEEYEFEVEGTGYYLVKIPCQNVYIASVKMLDETPFMRYTHPNLIEDGVKNVRILDFNKNYAGKPQAHGEVTFEAGTYPKYEIWNHLRFWTVYGTGNYIRPTDFILGDYFLQIIDHENNVPGLEWKFPHTIEDFDGKKGWGSENKYYGEYVAKYLFSGLHRVFLPQGEFENHGAGFNMLDNIEASLIFGGLTLDINYALCNNGYQVSARDNEIVPAVVIQPETALAKVAEDAYRKLQDNPNTKIYVVKYKTRAATGLDSCATNIYHADSESELKSRLKEIAEDIKLFAKYRDALVDETQ